MTRVSRKPPEYSYLQPSAGTSSQFSCSSTTSWSLLIVDLSTQQKHTSSFWWGLDNLELLVYQAGRNPTNTTELSLPAPPPHSTIFSEKLLTYQSHLSAAGGLFLAFTGSQYSVLIATFSNKFEVESSSSEHLKREAYKGMSSHCAFSVERF